VAVAVDAVRDGGSCCISGSAADASSSTASSSSVAPVGVSTVSMVLLVLLWLIVWLVMWPLDGPKSVRDRKLVIVRVARRGCSLSASMSIKINCVSYDQT